MLHSSIFSGLSLVGLALDLVD